MPATKSERHGVKG